MSDDCYSLPAGRVMAALDLIADSTGARVEMVAGQARTLVVSGTRPGLSWSALGPVGWVSMEPSSDGGSVSFVLTPPAGPGQESTLRVTARSADGSESTDIVLVVAGTSGPPSSTRPPVLASPGDGLVVAGRVVDVPVSAKDPEGAPVRWSLVDSPGWVSLTGQTATAVNVHAAPGVEVPAGRYQVTVSAVDPDLGEGRTVFALAVSAAAQAPGGGLAMTARVGLVTAASIEVLMAPVGVVPQAVGVGVGDAGGFVGFKQFPGDTSRVVVDDKFGLTRPLAAGGWTVDVLPSPDGKTFAPIASGGVRLSVAVPAAQTVPPPVVTPPVVVPPTKGGFSVVGADIVGPDGQVFIPRGINIVGADSYKGWGQAFVGHGKAGFWQDTWGLNAVRLVFCKRCASHPPGSNHYGDLDQLIAEYTSRRMVVMIDNHEGTLGPQGGKTAGDVAEAVAFFTPLAARYKDNPFVWFEPFNEPMEEGWGKPASAQWLAFMRPVVAAIRGQGARNVVVLCPSHYGQDRADTGPVVERSSAIMSFGPALAAEFGNVAFDLHFYSRWADGTTTDGQAADYFTRLRAKGLAVLIGETGAYSSGSAGIKGDDEACRRLYRVAPRGVGIFPWMQGQFDRPGGVTSDPSAQHWTWVQNQRKTAPAPPVPAVKVGVTDLALWSTGSQIEVQFRTVGPVNQIGVGLGGPAGFIAFTFHLSWMSPSSASPQDGLIVINNSARTPLVAGRQYTVDVLPSADQGVVYAQVGSGGLRGTVTV